MLKISKIIDAAKYFEEVSKRNQCIFTGKSFLSLDFFEFAQNLRIKEKNLLYALIELIGKRIFLKYNLIQRKLCQCL
jgi:hypothetical protein